MKKVGWRVITDTEVAAFSTLPGSDVSDPFVAWKPWESRTRAEVEHITAKCPDIAAFVPKEDPSRTPSSASTCITQQQLAELTDF